MQPSTRFATILLAAGAAVLLIAVALGERMGNRVIGQASEQTLQSVLPQAVTSGPNATPQAYGPDWKRSQALSAAGDPHFPDPARSAPAVAHARADSQAEADADSHADSESEHSDLAAEPVPHVWALRPAFAGGIGAAGPPS